MKETRRNIERRDKSTKEGVRWARQFIGRGAARRTMAVIDLKTIVQGIQKRNRGNRKCSLIGYGGSSVTLAILKRRSRALLVLDNANLNHRLNLSIDIYLTLPCSLDSCYTGHHFLEINKGAH